MVALDLVLFDGTDRRFALEEGCELLIGAAASAAVKLTGGDVSRSHALLSRRKGRLVLLDLGSTNGTFVNGKRIKDAVIQAGDAVRFSSVTAQVVPRDPRSSGVDTPSQVPAGWVESNQKTSDRLPAVGWAGRLENLIGRWARGGESAVSAFVQWCTEAGGAQGMAIIELRDGAVAVLAAEGEVSAALQDGAVRALAGGELGVGGTESIRFEAAQQQVLALRTPGCPSIFLALGHVTPDTDEIGLLVELLQVARRLDAGGEHAPDQTPVRDLSIRGAMRRSSGSPKPSRG